MYTYIFLYTGFILTGSENSILKFYSKFCRKFYSKKQIRLLLLLFRVQ